MNRKMGINVILNPSLSVILNAVKNLFAVQDGLREAISLGSECRDRPSGLSANVDRSKGPSLPLRFFAALRTAQNDMKVLIGCG